MTLNPNVSALRYAWWERLRFWLLGSWPDSTVRRLLEAEDAERKRLGLR